MDIKTLLNEEKIKEQEEEKHFSFLKTVKDFRDYGHVAMGYIYAFRAVLKFLDRTIKDFSEAEFDNARVIHAFCLEIRKRIDNELCKKQRLLKFFSRKYTELDFKDIKKEVKK